MLTSLTETLGVMRRVPAQVRVPAVLDLDNGYGDVDNTLRAVQGAEAAGIAAIQVEDQVLSKRSGHAAGIDTHLRKLERRWSREKTCVSSHVPLPRISMQSIERSAITLLART